MHNVKEILTGGLNKVIWKLSLPIMISNLLQTIYNLSDTFWVAKLGSSAIAALTISFPIIFFVIAMGSGLSTGSSILLSHLVGKAFKKKEKDKNKLDKVLTQTFLLFMLTFFLLSTFGFVETPALVKLMKAQGAVLNYAIVYLRTIFVGLIFMFLYYLFEATLRALGDTKTPMRFVSLSVTLNVILDPLMIFGIGFPKWGVFGAALATVISRAIIGLIAMYRLFKGTYGIQIRREYLKPDWSIIKEILRLGIPTSFSMSSMSIGILIMTGMINYFGTYATAAYGIVTRFFNLAAIPAMGIGVALSVIIAQNHGAENNERIILAMKKSLIIGTKIMAIIILVLFVFAKYIILAFTNEPQVLSMGTTFLRILSPFFIFVLVRNVFNGFFRGIKRTDISMFINIANSFLFRVPIAYLFAFIFNWKFLGIWWTYPTMMVFTSVLSYVIFLRFKKQILSIKKPKNFESLKIEAETEANLLSEE